MSESDVKKRSVTIMGHATSITLEEPFWVMLKDLAGQENISLNMLITQIDQQRTTNLSSALRLYILKNLQDKLLAAQ